VEITTNADHQARAAATKATRASPIMIRVNLITTASRQAENALSLSLRAQIPMLTETGIWQVRMNWQGIKKWINVFTAENIRAQFSAVKFLTSNKS
jgi:hypothetical protein